MFPIHTHNSLSSQSVETKTSKSHDGPTEVTKYSNNLQKRSPEISSESLCAPISKRKRIAASPDVQRQRERKAAALSRQRKKERTTKAYEDNENLKKELGKLKSQIGITLETTIAMPEQSEQSASSAKTTGIQFRPLLPKPPVLIKESELEMRERCTGQQSTPKQSLKEKKQIRDRGNAQNRRDAKKLALDKIETENANMASEIEDLKKIIKQQTKA